MPRPGINPNQTVYIEGLDDLRRLLTPPENLYAEPWKAAMQALAEQGERETKAAAPRLTGKLHEKIRGVVQKKGFPRWLAVRSRGVRKPARGSGSKSAQQFPRGYPYPRLLQYSAKHGHQGWFDRGTANMLAKAAATLNEVGDAIERKWGRKGWL